jgi:ABC-type Na+ efflux pump permease subunit
MKTKKALFMFSLIAALFLVTSQVIAAPQTFEAKKTPGVVATQKVDKQATKEADKATKMAEKQATKSVDKQATKMAEKQATKEVKNLKGKNENYKGILTAVDASNITLVLKDGTEITIALTTETRIKIPTNKEATVNDLVAGMKVKVQAIRGQDDSLTAKSVVLVPGKPLKTRNVGIVTDYLAGTSITIQAKDGQLYTFLLTEETKILPTERLDLLVIGARVTIISPRDVTSMEQTATGIVIHPADTEE